MKKSVFVLFALIFVIPSICSAGWRIKEGSLLLDYMTIVSIQGDKMMTVNDNDVVIYDFSTGEITIYYLNSKTYWKGKVEEYKDGFIKALEGLLKVSDQDVAAFIKDMIAQAKRPINFGLVERPNINIVETGESENIAGLPSIKYEIRVNGRIYRNVWLTKTITPFKNLDITSFIVWNRVMMPSINAEYYYEDTPEYVDLLKNGYITKIVNLDAGGVIENKVSKAEVIVLPEDTFEIPEGFQKVSAEVMIGNMMNRAFNAE